MRSAVWERGGGGAHRRGRGRRGGEARAGRQGGRALCKSCKPRGRRGRGGACPGCCTLCSSRSRRSPPLPACTANLFTTRGDRSAGSDNTDACAARSPSACCTHVTQFTPIPYTSFPAPPLRPGPAQADKWRITHKLGIQTRDLRLLDPNLSTTYPSAILCRDKVGWVGFRAGLAGLRGFRGPPRGSPCLEACGR